MFILAGRRVGWLPAGALRTGAREAGQRGAGELGREGERAAPAGQLVAPRTSLQAGRVAGHLAGCWLSGCLVGLLSASQPVRRYRSDLHVNWCAGGWGVASCSARPFPSWPAPSWPGASHEPKHRGISGLPTMQLVSLTSISEQGNQTD